MRALGLTMVVIGWLLFFRWTIRRAAICGLHSDSTDSIFVPLVLVPLVVTGVSSINF